MLGTTSNKKVLGLLVETSSPKAFLVCVVQFLTKNSPAIHLNSLAIRDNLGFCQHLICYRRDECRPIVENANQEFMQL